MEPLLAKRRRGKSKKSHEQQMNLLCQFHTHPVQHLVKSFQSHALLLVCRLLHPYAISKNRQAAISLLEVLACCKRAKLEFSQTNSSMTDFSASFIYLKLDCIYSYYAPTAPFITSERAISSASCIIIIKKT